MNELIIIGIEETAKLMETLLRSGYKVRAKYLDEITDHENFWRTRRYIVQYESDPDWKPIEATLQDLFDNQDKEEQ